MTTRVMNMHYSFPVKFFSEGSTVFNNPLSNSFRSYMTQMIAVLSEVDAMADYATKRRAFMPFGEDFRYQNNADNLYTHIDTLLILVNSNNASDGAMPQAKGQYSDMKSYFDGLEDNQTKLDIKPANSDFMPYTNRKALIVTTDGTWTGYYTTRPWLKKYYQEYSSLTRIYSTLSGIIKNHIEPLTLRPEPLNTSIDKAKWWVGVLSHHDAITGVSRSFVAENYYQTAQANIDDLSAVFWSSHDILLAKNAKALTNLVYTT